MSHQYLHEACLFRQCRTHVSHHNIGDVSDQAVANVVVLSLSMSICTVVTGTPWNELNIYL